MAELYDVYTHTVYQQNAETDGPNAMYYHNLSACDSILARHSHFKWCRICADDEIYPRTQQKNIINSSCVSDNKKDIK